MDRLDLMIGGESKGVFISLCYVLLNLIGTILCLFLILTFIIYPSTRRSPGDILLSLSVTDFFKCFILLMNSAFWLIYGVTPQADSFFCDFSATISTFVYFANMMYSSWFCITIMNIVKGKLVRKSIFRSEYFIHAGIITISILFTVLIMIFQDVGPDFFGMCGEQIDKGYFTFLDIFFYIMTVVIAFKTYNFIKKKLPQTSRFAVQKLEMSQYYSKYIQVIRFYFIVKFTFICTLLLLIVFLMTGKAELGAFMVFVVVIAFFIAYFLQVLQPFLLVIVRTQDPIIKPKLIRMYNYLFHGRQLINNRDENWYSLLTLNIKQTLLYTILHGLIEICRMKNENTNLQDIEQLRIAQQENLLEMQVYQYCPRIFNYLCCRDSSMIDIQKSLSSEKNIDQIQQFSGPDGGKSGEFFLFSSDNRLVLKTITQEELDSLTEIMDNYTNYITQNETMLSIFYGIYTFQRYDIQSDPIHMVIQRNIAQTTSSYISRTYDIKGSELAREVRIDPSRKSQTLKDKNFEYIEGKIKISPNESEKICKIIERDVLFLKSLGFMDYSLLVIKVNWQLYCKDYSIEIDDVKNRFSNSLCMLESTEEKGIYYHIAIIDYLQKWNIQKKMEKTSKTIIYGDANQSAVDPEQYAERFIKKIVGQYFSK